MKIGNLTRHTLALDCIGRLKIKALQERLVSISPYVKYYTSDVPGTEGMPGSSAWKSISLALFDLENDVAEQHDVSGEYPEVVRRLLKYVAKAREDLGDGVKRVDKTQEDFFRARTVYKIKGKNTREPGRVKW